MKLTSFGGSKSIDSFRFRNETIRQAHLPIFPCDAHPETDQLLFLEEERELRKRSYVKLNAAYEVGWGLLGEYDDGGNVFELTKQSWDDLTDAMKFFEREYSAGG